MNLLRFWRATINSRNGLIFAMRSEQAIREELVALVLSLPLAWLAGATMMRRVELVSAVVLVLIVELLNTAIEKLVRPPDHRSRSADRAGQGHGLGGGRRDAADGRAVLDLRHRRTHGRDLKQPIAVAEPIW